MPLKCETCSPNCKNAKNQYLEKKTFVNDEMKIDSMNKKKYSNLKTTSSFNAEGLEGLFD
jgi:hypothetical protein